MRPAPDVDAVERRLGNEDPSRLEQLPHELDEIGEEQGGDVVAVGIGVGQQHHPPVAELLRVAVIAGAAAERQGDVP